MKILIAGSGDTGTYLSKYLSYENQDVVLMSCDRDYLAGLDADYNLMTFAGDPVSVGALKAAGAGQADLFIGVSPDETVNIVSAQLAHNLGAGKCIVRVERPEMLDEDVADWFAAAGIASMVYPESLVAREIARFIKRNWASEWVELHESQLLLIGVRITDSSVICGRVLRDVFAGKREVHVSAIRRRHRLIIPRGDDIVLPRDMVYFTLLPSSLDTLINLVGVGATRVRNVMISGAGRITESLLPLLKNGYNVTLIDGDREACRKMAVDFPYVTVVNALPRDFSVMKDEQIQSMDLFVALSDSSEKNIVACMVARESGVRRTVAQIEDIEYIAEAEGLNIDKVVNKKLITSANILRYILGADAKVERMISFEDAEVAEIEVRENSKITRCCVRDLKLPADVTLGGLIRDGRGMLINGETRIMPGDKVMVFFLPGSLLRVERLFRM